MHSVFIGEGGGIAAPFCLERGSFNIGKQCRRRLGRRGGRGLGMRAFGNAFPVSCTFRAI